MKITKLEELSLDLGIVVKILNRWSLTELEPDLSPIQAEEIRKMKTELYNRTVVDIAEFLTDEGYVVFSGEQFLTEKLSVSVPGHG